MENSYNGFLLRFITVYYGILRFITVDYGLLRLITDITEFYYGYDGTFLMDFIDSESRHQKKSRNPHI